METLRNIISTNSGMRFMVENLELCSPAARQMLLSQPMMHNPSEIEIEYDYLRTVANIVNQEANLHYIEAIKHDLFQLHDISGTILNLANAVVPDDIDFFEIKKFCLLSEALRENLSNCHCTIHPLPNLTEAIAILDPENQKLPQFYIYPAYSNELMALRKLQQNLLLQDPDQAETIRQKCVALEDTIRQQLAMQLYCWSPMLKQAHDNLAKLDILFAKAIQALKMNLIIPQLAQETTTYAGLFNPMVKSTLEKEKKQFQPVDVMLEEAPCLITGANMGGKTVLLKSVALAQYLFQFGFFIPAHTAHIVPVDSIFFSLEDNQSELTGLSSFATEMLNINKLLLAVRSGKHILALIDEPARTTNPKEGSALVNALIGLLEKAKVRSMITTHYGNIHANCRKLMVKGLQFSELNSKITFQNLNEYMDYSLVELQNAQVPQEALQIAAILGVDQELLDSAASILKQN